MTIASKPAPLHTDTMSYAARIHDGHIPASWNEAASEGVAKANVIAAIAWEQVRDRRDPPFPACSYVHRENLIAEVEAMLKAGPPSKEAATPFTDAAYAIIASINESEQLQLPGETDQGDI